MAVKVVVAAGDVVFATSQVVVTLPVVSGLKAAEVMA